MKASTLLVCLAFAHCYGAANASEPIVIDLWPGDVPGPSAKVDGPERDLTEPDDRLIAGRPIVKLGHVSQPQVHVYLPEPSRANGGAVLVCPGGGFSILAWDLEGTEVAEWLNELGLAAAVLKYRVPTRHHESPGKWEGPVMDAQRALSILRTRAVEWQLDPNRIGILGFSAGGESAALTAVKNGERLYQPADETDEASCAANFALLIYPGGIAEQDGTLKADYLVDEHTPPMFFAHAADDHVTCLSSVALFTALKRLNVPAELHIYASGGHGYGLRPTESPVTRWPSHAEAWFRGRQLLTGGTPSPAGHPADHLPPHIRRLTWLGERPDWRHDSRRFVFASKIFGEVYEYDLATGRTYSLSDHFLHNGFTRALYLSNGDLLLVGPSETFERTVREDRHRARRDIGEMFVLQRPFDRPPIPLGVEVDEGPAVARNSLQIGWTHGSQSEISVGEIEYDSGVPKLVNTRKVLDVADFPVEPAILETQNFVPPENRKITVSGYKLGGGNNTDTFLLDLDTTELTNITNSPSSYDEPEGIFPDGRFTLVEHGSSEKSAWPLIDLYKLSLDGSGELQRLTHFTDGPGWKASQGVVSDDGRSMLFQIGKSGDEAGRGYGVFLYDLGHDGTLE